MDRPYDLLAFLNQDTRWDNIINLHHDLKKRQRMINKLWSRLERDTDVNTIILHDDNCLKAGSLHAIDWYTSFLEDGKSKIPIEEFSLHTIHSGHPLYIDVPDCKKISSLTFSMCTFEHLEVNISGFFFQ